MVLDEFSRAIFEISESIALPFNFLTYINGVSLKSEVIVNNLQNLFRFLADWFAEVVKEQELARYEQLGQVGDTLLPVVVSKNRNRHPSGSLWLLVG